MHATDNSILSRCPATTVHSDVEKSCPSVVQNDSDTSSGTSTRDNIDIGKDKCVAK